MVRNEGINEAYSEEMNPLITSILNTAMNLMNDFYPKTFIDRPTWVVCLK